VFGTKPPRESDPLSEKLKSERTLHAFGDVPVSFAKHDEDRRSVNRARARDRAVKSATRAAPARVACSRSGCSQCIVRSVFGTFLGTLCEHSRVRREIHEEIRAITLVDREDRSASGLIAENERQRTTNPRRRLRR